MVELKGSLNGIGLPAIVQLIGDLHHSGALQLSRDDFAFSGTLLFDDGRLVGAECGDNHGLQAVAACAVDLANADFSFVEAPPPAERTLDLGSEDLKKLLARAASGGFNTTTTYENGYEHSYENDTAATDQTQSQTQTSLDVVACPLLGFADDPTRHYSRATALHRCFATGLASLVTPDEQRELCLSGRFSTCPRFRNMQLQQAAQPTRPAADEPTLITPIPAPKPVAPIAPVTPATPAAQVPPGVAARLDAATQMRVVPVAAETPAASAAPVATEVSAGIADEETIAWRQPDALAAPPQPAPVQRPTRPAVVEEESSRRGLFFIAGGVIGGLLLVALVLFVLVPALTPRPATPASAPALEPVPTAGRIAAPASRATAIATLVAQPTTAPTAIPTPTTAAIAAPTTPPRLPTPAVGAGVQVAGAQSLMDVRFASGPVDGWLDNPPYAGWSDGAYRIQAIDAARFVAVGVPLGRVLGDVVVSGTFRKTGGPPGGGYGLIVRDQGPEPRDGVNQQARAYVLETSDLGEYGVWRRDGDHWVDLVPWMRSTSVRPGGSPNDLSVRAVGEHLTFSVNGDQLADVQDDTLIAGGVGLFVGGDYNEVAVDHFAVALPD